MNYEKLVRIFPLTTKTVPPYTTTNAVIYGKNDFMVIDPGSSKLDQQELIAKYLEERILLGHKFLGVYLTHHHGDHTRAASYLAKRFSTQIYAHQNALPILGFEAFAIDSMPTFSDSTLTAIYTPGHSDDHMVFYDDSGILIAGDMITDRGTVLIPPGSGGLKPYLKNLEMLCSLKLVVIIPAHGEPIKNAPNRFLLLALKHRYERILSVLNALEPDFLDATDLTLKIYGSNLPENLKIFAELSVLSSLEWLEDVGLIKKANYRFLADKLADKRLILDPIEQIDERLRYT